MGDGDDGWFRVQGSWFKVKGSGLRVHGSWLRVASIRRCTARIQFLPEKFVFVRKIPYICGEKQKTEHEQDRLYRHSARL